jgi:hypothetical protein
MIIRLLTCRVELLSGIVEGDASVYTILKPATLKSKMSVK